MSKGGFFGVSTAELPGKKEERGKRKKEEKGGEEEEKEGGKERDRETLSFH